MPSLGVDMRAGRLVDWKVKPGDRVRRGDVIATVETDKSNVDVEIYENGVVDRLAANPGDRLPVGTLLAVIRGEGEAAAPAAAPPKRIAASPLARRKAREFGIDLATLTGTGP